MWPDCKKYLHAMMLFDAFCICASCCTVIPKFQAPCLFCVPAYFILRKFPTPLPVRTPHLLGIYEYLQALLRGHCVPCKKYCFSFFLDFQVGERADSTVYVNTKCKSANEVFICFFLKHSNFFRFITALHKCLIAYIFSHNLLMDILKTCCLL